MVGKKDTLTRAESGGPIGGERYFWDRFVEEPKI